MLIEQVILDYLIEEVQPIPCYMEKPFDNPDEYILIEKTGSGQSNRICSATIAVQSYAQSMFRAAEINELVKDAMESMPILNCVSKCSLNSDYNYTDTQMKAYRYQAVFDVFFYKEINNE